jgi:hypothetical protein
MALRGRDGSTGGRSPSTVPTGSRTGASLPGGLHKGANRGEDLLDPRVLRGVLCLPVPRAPLRAVAPCTSHLLALTPHAERWSISPAACPSMPRNVRNLHPNMDRFRMLKLGTAHPEH